MEKSLNIKSKRISSQSCGAVETTTPTQRQKQPRANPLQAQPATIKSTEEEM